MVGQSSPEGPSADVLAHLPSSGIRAYLEFSQVGYDMCLEARQSLEQVSGSSTCANVGSATNRYT